MQVATIIEQIRPLVRELTPTERQELMNAIELIEPAEPIRADALDERHARLVAEQEAWLARPASDRQRYQGEYVAVYNGEVVEHDPDERALYLRVRTRFAAAPILIMHANWDAVPEFTIHTATGFIRPANRQALSLLETWTAEPAEYDEAWWDELESELRENRFSLERPE